MLRRKSLRKIVYTATILFVTIVLYAGTSNNDYARERRKEWTLPIAVQEAYHVDADLQEPLNRLPLGPFEDDSLPVMLEEDMPLQEFEDLKYEDVELPGDVLTYQSNTAFSRSTASALGINPQLPAIPGDEPLASAVPFLNDTPNASLPQDQMDLQAPAELGLLQDMAAHLPIYDGKLSEPAAPNSQLQAYRQITKPIPDLNRTVSEIARRLNHTRYQCENLKIPNQIDSDIYHLPQFNLSYCKIPKAGCTFWEQVISYLSKSSIQLSHLGIKMPFQISKFDIRYTSHFNLPRLNFNSAENKAEIMKATRLLFVRHPLERLWSCYLEKFYLIDFWTTAGVEMRTSGAEVKCPKAITFREFIDYTLPLFNENWAPMTELCNPCVYQPHIIGHVESLRNDSYYTLKKLNLEWIFSEYDRFSREENQMLDMAIYNYQIHSIHWYNFFHKCLSQRELAARLWDVFKKVGYLSSHAALPDNLPDYNQSTILTELRLQSRKFPLGPVNGRAQQLKMMRRDYDSLPKPTMEKVLERYSIDFQLFGYSAQLPSI